VVLQLKAVDGRDKQTSGTLSGMTGTRTGGNKLDNLPCDSTFDL
jgi:hypothetical protein